MTIRWATTQDCKRIQAVYEGAFAEAEGESVAKLAMELLDEESTPQTICLVAESSGDMVGHVAFSPVVIHSDDALQGYILAPLAVQSDSQGQGIGSMLVEHGMRQLAEMAVNVVFVYGDPEYYGRFGFDADAARQYTAPYKLQYPFGWQARVLNPGNLEQPPVAISCVNALCDPELW